MTGNPVSIYQFSDSQIKEFALSILSEIQKPSVERGPETKSEIISENQLIERLGVSKVFLWQLRKKGKLRYMQMGKRVLYDYSNVLEDFQKNGKDRFIKR